MTRVVRGNRASHTSPAYTWFFLVVVHDYLGNHDEPHRCYEQAIRLTELEAGDIVNPKRIASWTRQLTLGLLHNETSQLLSVVQPQSVEANSMKMEND